MKNTLRKANKPFGSAPNRLLNDEKISLKAKGLFVYMESKSDNWNFTIRSMATQLKEGKNSIQSAMSELKEFGYLMYEKMPSGEGLYTLLWEPNPDYRYDPCPENRLYPKQGRISNKDLHSKKDNKTLFGKLPEENKPTPSPPFNWSTLLDHIKKHTGREFRIINNTVRASFKARLRDGYQKIDIFNAVINASRIKSHRENGCQYLTPEFFSRASTLDKYGFKPKETKSDDQIRNQGGHVVA